jgi:hypothetical protein
MMEGLSSKCEALSSNPSTAKKKKKIKVVNYIIFTIVSFLLPVGRIPIHVSLALDLSLPVYVYWTLADMMCTRVKADALKSITLFLLPQERHVSKVLLLFRLESITR